MIWVLLILTIFAAFLFGGIESALISVSRVRARHAASEGDAKAERLAAQLERRPELLEAAMAVHHFFSMASFVIFAVICRHLWGAWGLLVAVVIAVPLFLLLLELAPKAIFRLYPFRMLRRLTGTLGLLQTTAFLWRAPGRVLHAALENNPAPSEKAESGLDTLVNNITSLKLLPANADTLLENYAAFAPLTAADLVTPWSAISAIPADMPVSSALQLARQTNQRHHPVLGPDGNVIGFFDAAALPARLPSDRFVRQFTQPLGQISESTAALRCLQVLRKSGVPMALVTNSGPRPSGVVTLSSLVSRILNLPKKTAAVRYSVGR